MKYLLLMIAAAVLFAANANAGSETWGTPDGTEPRDPAGPTHLWPIWSTGVDYTDRIRVAYCDPSRSLDVLP